MKPIEAFQDAAVCEGFEMGRTLSDRVAAETGLSVLEVFQRQLDLKLISVDPTGDSDCNVQISA